MTIIFLDLGILLDPEVTDRVQDQASKPAATKPAATIARCLKKGLNGTLAAVLVERLSPALVEEIAVLPHNDAAHSTAIVFPYLPCSRPHAPSKEEAYYVLANGLNDADADALAAKLVTEPEVSALAAAMSDAREIARCCAPRRPR